MINFKYLSSGNEERIYDYLNNLSNCQGCFCTKSYIRFLHAVSGAPAVDIYINGNMVSNNLKLGELTDYILNYQGDHNISIYATGDNKKPLLNKTITINKNASYTAAIAGNINNYDLYLTKDNKEEVPPFREAVVTYTNYTPIDETLDLYISDGTMLYKNVGFSDYMPNILIFPTDERFDLKYSGTDELVTSTPTIELQRNTYYSLFSILDDDKVKLIITLSGLNYLDLC